MGISGRIEVAASFGASSSITPSSARHFSITEMVHLSIKSALTRPAAPQDQVYGGPRPLFQGISFHDTPEAPIPEMRYLDTSSHVGEKHTYTVITLNSAGGPSEPSAPATVP
jgi:hypothetical protein